MALLEAIEIATTDGTMQSILMEELPRTPLDDLRGAIHMILSAKIVWHGLTGAHRHHHLDLLVDLVVHLDQLPFHDATDMDASRRRIGGACHHPAPS